MVALAQAIASGAVRSPFVAATLRRHVRDGVADNVANVLNALGGEAMATSVAAWLMVLADERASVQLAQDQAQLVWTGPEGTRSTARDTWVTMTELFRSAQSSIDIASYAIHDGKHVLEELVQRMREIPALRVRMFLHIHRQWGDTTTSNAQLVRAFAKDFKDKHWADDVPLPEVYFDPRTIAVEPEKRASLHAKVVVVDGLRALVTSANLTEAAQHRNIEAGIVVANDTIAKGLRQQFDGLIDSGAVLRVTFG